MKALLQKELKSGYKLLVLMDPEYRLATQLTNSKDEFVGQLYTSIENLKDTVLRVSNSEVELTSDEVNSITSEQSKSESAMFDKLRMTLKTT